MVASTARKVRRQKEDYLTHDGLAICSKCQQAKPLSAYSNGRGGQWCKACRSELEAERRRLAGVKQRPKSQLVDGKKLCTACGVLKGFSEFYPASRGLGGLSAYCKPCRKHRYYSRSKGREARARYKVANRERYLAAHSERMRRVREIKAASSDGSVTSAFIQGIYATNTCHYCRSFVARGQRTMDHKIPLSRGGGHIAGNIVMSCFTCNASKGAKTDIEFTTELGNVEQR